LEAAQQQKLELPHGADAVPLLSISLDVLLLNPGEDGLP